MRINTFSLNFAAVKEKLDIVQYHRYIENNLKLKSEDVLSFGLYGAKVCIKVNSHDLYEKIFEDFEGKLFYTNEDGSKSPVILENESSKVIVKIHRVPLEMENTAIRGALKNYGAIDSIKNDKWCDLPYMCYNDIKLVKMEVRKVIPPFLYIGQKQYPITYLGQSRMTEINEKIRGNSDVTIPKRINETAVAENNEMEDNDRYREVEIKMEVSKDEEENRKRRNLIRSSSETSGESVGCSPKKKLSKKSTDEMEESDSPISDIDYSVTDDE